MKIVLDTNVLIAASISRGVCHKLFEQCIVEHTIVTSDFLLSEFREKLISKFRRPAKIVDSIIQHFSSQMVVVTPAAVGKISRDPDDDIVIGTAVAGDCRVIVSGDRDLLDLRQFRGIRILSPREFLDWEEVS